VTASAAVSASPAPHRANTIFAPDEDSSAERGQGHPFDQAAEPVHIARAGLRLHSADAEVQSLKKRLAALRNSGTPPPLTAVAASGTAAHLLVTPRIEACPVCKRVSDVLFEFLCQFQYELVSSAEARQRFAATGGLCGAHVRLYASMESERGICLALVPLLQRLTATLRDAVAQAGSDASSSAPREILRAADAECILCRIQNDTELKAIQELAAGQDRAQSTAHDPPPFLCLPHLRMTTSYVGNRSWLRTLLQNEAGATERLTEDMQRYALKRDGIRHRLATEEESQAAKAAIALIAGPH
jgi:hypothetical protein